MEDTGELQTKNLLIAIGSLCIVLVIILIITVLSLAKLCKGKPPVIYQQMIEKTPTILARQQEQQKKCDVRVVITLSFLMASQFFKLAYYGCVAKSL